MSGDNNQIACARLGGYNTQILIDGERPPPGFTLEQLSPTLIERIEIIRAATAEFSTQSIAGTVNIVLKKKVSFSQKELRHYASGSFYKFSGANFVLADKIGDLGYNVNGWPGTTPNNSPFVSTERHFDAAGVQTVNARRSRSAKGSGSHGGLAPRLNWNMSGGDCSIGGAALNGWRGDSEAASVT